jgi:hypothetical protein
MLNCGIMFFLQTKYLLTELRYCLSQLLLRCPPTVGTFCARALLRNAEALEWLCPSRDTQLCLPFFCHALPVAHRQDILIFYQER